MSTRPVSQGLKLSPPFRKAAAILVLISLTLGFLVLPKSWTPFLPTVNAASPDIVISQVYGGAGCTTVGCSTYKNDYIELFNRGASPVSLNGWSIQYASATGSSWQTTALTNVSLQPGHYYLVTESFNSNGVNAVPTGDATGTIAMSATAAKVALVNSATALSAACPSGSSIVDLVGYGSTATCSETSPAPAPSTSNAIFRAGGGCTDTDNNAADFTALGASPRNSASATNTCAASTSPSGVGAANPNSVNAGGSVLLTVTVTPGTNPTSTSLTVTADLSAIGDSATQSFLDNGTNGDATTGDNTFSFNATVSANTSAGGKTLPFTITDGQSRSGSGNISLTVQASPTPTPTPTPNGAAGSVVISQVYGGGGNTGSTLTNDFIELINHSPSPVSLNGWSLQVFSTQSSSWEVTPLTNVAIQPGQYYLVQESQGAGGTQPLPSPDASGTIAVSSTSSKVALVNSVTALTGTCPTGSGIVDFVGYGTSAGCFEGSGPAPTLSNTTAALRLDAGCFDTNDNANDFVSGEPAPRNTSSPNHDCTGISGFGSAAPSSVLQGQSSTLTVHVAAGQNPDSTGVAVTGDLSGIGGSANQTFGGSDTTFTFVATAPADNAPGLKSLPVTISDAQGRSFHTDIKLTVLPVVPDHIVISQIYGGGGNTNATYRNDYVELYNPTSSPVDVGGWTIQYSSSTGTSWQVQPLGGILQPNDYYLISLASGGSVGSPLPAANVLGSINMSGTTGKVSLSNSGDAFLVGCPVGDSTLVDFVGYGTADCHEGSTNAPAPNSTTSIFRKNGGQTDTNVNGADFVTGPPNPRRTAMISEIGPYVLNVDPRSNSTGAPHDDSITINFTEAVDVDSSWYNISCAGTGSHNDATVTHTSDFKTYVITPNTNFQFGEVCTAKILQNAVHDQDTDDSEPGTDTLKANYIWSFTVVDAGLPAPYPPSVHLTMGNPSCGSPVGCATADVGNPNNYLMEKPTYALSYNRDKGTPNWVSWHLSSEWYGSLARVDSFRPDPAVPVDWYRVQAFDFSGAGFDRGHMTPNADRDNQNRIPINQETYLMSNMVPQSPDNNQGPWAQFEGYLRSLADAGNELYIVSGPFGVGGTGSNGGVTTTLANGHVTVPAATWKVVLVLPKADGDDVSRITAATRTIAIQIPNVQGIRGVDWHTYLTTVDNVENETGYDFFSNAPVAVQNAIEAGVDGSNPPGTADQSIQTNEDTSVQFTLDAVDPANSPLTASPVQPTHGSVSCTGLTCNYSPASNFTGTDNFTYSVSNGTKTSNTSTVTINVGAVNDAPSFTSGPDQTVLEDSGAQTINAFATNISAGPPDELSQTLSFGVTNDNNSLFAIQPAINPDGTLTYTTATNAFGSAKVSVTLKDNGGTANGGADTSAAQTFNINVTAVNDAPSFTKGADQTVSEDSGSQTVTGWATGISTGPPNEASQTVSFEVTNNSNSALFSTQPAVSAGGTLTYTPAANANGTATITLRIKDNGGTTNGGIDTSATQMFTITVQPINDGPSATNDLVTQSVQYSDAVQTVTVTGTDIDSTSLSASTSYTKDGGASQTGLPNGLSFSSGNCTPSNNGSSSVGSICTWTVSGRALVSPGSYVLTVKVDDGSLQSTTTITITVTQEDARADYTGAMYASTASASSDTANVTLAATIRDISALCDRSVDPACDNLEGDIANATVTFVNRDTNTVLASNVPIGYVTIGDTKVGTATTNVTLSTGTGDSAQYTIGIIVSGYYSRDNSADDAVVTVSKPVPGLISGGGHIALTNPAGQRAGDVGSKTNFGFNIKNERNGPKGNVNILVRRTESDGILHTYQIKGNSMTSLSSSLQTGTATFNGKANIQDITFANDPVNPHVISIDGNASLQIVMTDGSITGGDDSIAITLWNKSGGLWFASKWNGFKTVEQILSGGNLQVQ